MCKKDRFTNLKYDCTWQHDSLTKSGYKKSTSPKHVIFERWCKLHQNFICSNYKLSMATFNNICQVQSNCMEASSICAWCVEQLFVALDLAHTCHGSLSQMTSSLNCPKNLLHHNLHLICICQLAHQICFRPQTCLVLFGHLLKGISILDSL